ncbi:hypothetical protein SAMN03080618_00712 [Aquamicrobium aerolatum DSM 21857]|uniref:Uncharacterized protein n=1 Tax=Aquamicrobium aerolatum DSM 21857 TaxID=1121003 RepID=A0A1I3IYV9_9HYPH|nr:hypothetical protein SAMN03080618_00712 [Aquamicrobium aerolatum DSM 21857]
MIRPSTFKLIPAHLFPYSLISPIPLTALPACIPGNSGYLARHEP